MTLANTVSKDEVEVIRLYEIALPDDQARAVTKPDVAQALGVSDLDPDYVDVLAVETLDDLGLRGYLTDGLGISDEALAPYKERIAEVSGHAVVVLSKAFKGRAATLKNAHPLRLIGAFKEAHSPIKAVDLTSASATEKAAKPEKKRKSQAAQSGMVATLALIFLFLFVAIIVWLA